jgi:hypothetical protein
MAEEKKAAKKAAKKATSAKKAGAKKAGAKKAGAKKAAPAKKAVSSSKRAPTHAEIAEHAYYIAEREGGSPEDNWLRAERELRGN